jgi:Trk-type K+ transport system membrane component
VVGIIAILISESEKFTGDAGLDPDYSVFKVFFEAVSAFGTVGLSLGSGTFFLFQISEK